MKGLLFLHAACVLLLLWTQTAFVSCNTEKTIKVDELHDAIRLTCPDTLEFTISNTNNLTLEYKDSKSGEYQCQNADGEVIASIYVKFRTCDNCIEMDTASIAGMAIGDVVATCVVGVAVYLFASVIRGAPVTSSHKKSDRQPPGPKGASNDPYQALRFHSPKDEYDELNPKK